MKSLADQLIDGVTEGGVATPARLSSVGLTRWYRVFFLLYLVLVRSTLRFDVPCAGWIGFRLTRFRGALPAFLPARALEIVERWRWCCCPATCPRGRRWNVT